MTAGIHIFSLAATRCLSADAFSRLRARVEGMRGSGAATIAEDFASPGPTFSRLEEVSGMGRFTVPVNGLVRIVGMCSASLPSDLRVTEPVDVIGPAAAVEQHVRGLSRRLQELQLVDYYDLTVLSAAPENDDSILDCLDALITPEASIDVAHSDVAVVRFNVPIGEVLLIISRDRERAELLQERALELGRLRGGCRDLIVRIRKHRDDQFAPYVAAFAGDPSIRHGQRPDDRIDDLVARRHELFDFSQALRGIDHDRECLSEYAADVDARLALSQLVALALTPARDALNAVDVAPIQRTFQELKERYANTAAYLSDRIELAFAQTNHAMSRDVRRLQVVQVILAVAVIGLALAQFFHATSGDTHSKTPATNSTTPTQTRPNVTTTSMTSTTPTVTTRTHG